MRADPIFSVDPLTMALSNVYSSDAPDPLHAFEFFFGAIIGQTSNCKQGAMSSSLSSHVLNTVTGKPARGLKIKLEVQNGEGEKHWKRDGDDETGVLSPRGDFGESFLLLVPVNWKLHF